MAQTAGDDKDVPFRPFFLIFAETFERLQNYKKRRGLPTFEQALEMLLNADEAKIKKNVSL